MLHTLYFLIEPNPKAIREFPVRVGSENAALLLEAVLTSRDFADSAQWRDAELEMVVKLLFLARIREYEPFADDLCAAHVLGSDRISLEVFDRWWSIRVLSMEEGRSEEMHDYLKSMLGKLEGTGNPLVDTWARHLSDAPAA